MRSRSVVPFDDNLCGAFMIHELLDHDLVIVHTRKRRLAYKKKIIRIIE